MSITAVVKASNGAQKTLAFPDVTVTGAATPFLGWPSHAPYNISGGTNVLIEKVSIRGGTPTSPQGVAITIRNVTGPITIRDVDIADCVGGIYIYNCAGVVDISWRSRNIGDGSIGSGHSNHIQFAECSVEGRVHDFQCLGGKTEDMVSTWNSGGRGLGHELVIEDGHLQGLVSDTATARAWVSANGTGIMISDGVGSPKGGWIITRRNKIRTPGQVGIQHGDGQGFQTYGNILYGEKNPRSNRPMTSWGGTPYGEVYNNRYYWLNPNGLPIGPWWDSGSHLNVHDNVQDATINPADLAVAL